jgi:hypothetical protein
MAGDDYRDFLVRFGLDLAAILVVGVGLYARRHRRRDLVLVFTTFNVGVFAVLAVITEHKIGAAVGFGLFALLSIIRLRSEPFANVELGYFFACLVLAVVNGISHGDLVFSSVVDVIVIVAIFALDHPRFQQAIETRLVTLDAVFTDADELCAELERRFGVEIVELRINEIDYVRETTAVAIRYLDRSRRRASASFAFEQLGGA